MKTLFIAGVLILLTGCASLYAVVPYLPAAKTAYCAAADEQTRDAIREKYNLPQVIYCSGDD